MRVVSRGWCTTDGEGKRRTEQSCGRQFGITVRRGSRLGLTGARDALESAPAFLSRGPEAMLTAFLDEIVDGYAPVVAGLQEDIDEIEDSVFGDGDVDPSLSERIY